MELDNRVGEYAAAIVRDADLLLADAASLNVEQQQFIDKIKHSIIHFKIRASLRLFSRLKNKSELLDKP